MPTTNHARLNNLAAIGASTTTWLLSMTRAMKKAGWKFKASSNGTTKISNGDPAADQWGSGVVTNTGAAAASIAAPTQGRATVTGLTGIVAADKGKFLTITGATTGANNNQHQIEEILSSTSVRIDARQFAVASDASNGALTWTIKDPMLDTYNFALDTNAAWWCAQGPSILRIPFTSASSGTFVRGENIVQASTNAEGELLGYTFFAGVGYLNIAPRVRGSGGGVYGWATGNIVTGGSSGATLTQVGTALEYVYEIVIAKPAGQTALAQLLVGQFETVAESAELFSFCATQAGATAAIHPGGGGTGNTFGAHAWVMWGTGTAPGAGLTILGSGASTLRGHVICVDAIPEAGYSADGSWSLIYAYFNPGLNDGFTVFGLQRLNDIEDADFAPYVSINPGGSKALYGQQRTTAGSGSGLTSSTGFPFFATNAAIVAFNGWRRRGLTNESFSEFETAVLLAYQSNQPAAQVNRIDVMRIVTSPDTTARVREPIWIISTALGSKVLKGTLKWYYVFPGEQSTDVFGTDPAWVQISGSTVLGVIAGPHDGTPWVLNLNS